jgi:hypothetical protein
MILTHRRRVFIQDFRRSGLGLRRGQPMKLVYLKPKSRYFRLLRHNSWKLAAQEVPRTVAAAGTPSFIYCRRCSWKTRVAAAAHCSCLEAPATRFRNIRARADYLLLLPGGLKVNRCSAGVRRLCNSRASAVGAGSGPYIKRLLSAALWDDVDSLYRKFRAPLLRHTSTSETSFISCRRCRWKTRVAAARKSARFLEGQRLTATV